jgi:hypothetical protein
MKIIVCKIRGRLWRVLFKRLSGAWGYCEHETRTITIEKNANEKMTLDAVCHEVAHARFPYLTEEEIEGFGSDLANVLWELFWRDVM